MSRRLARISGFGEPAQAITHAFSGFDHRHSGGFEQRDYDHQGFVFFTRPRMNLSYDNLSMDRQMMPLATPRTDSMYRALRVMLDPRLPDVEEGEGAESDIFDHRQAFMPLLSNLCQSLSGFPDITLETYTSPEGRAKESFSHVDDIADIYHTYDITANFENIAGNPITTLYHMWTRYASNVYLGQQVPYPDMVIENEVDYQTRIYRILLDKSKRFVKKIGAANVAFPIADPLGAEFNFQRETPFTEENLQVSIPFRAIGAEYHDPILIREFNQTVKDFNPAMRDSLRDGIYHRLNAQEAELFNFTGYPYINEETLELEWWIQQSLYDEVMGEFGPLLTSDFDAGVVLDRT